MAGLGEYWLVHPTDRVFYIYRLAEGRYSKPDVQPTAGETPVATLPGLAIQWATVFPESVT